jgi:hypothetical protein
MFHHTEVAPPNTMQEAADRMEQMRADPKFQERIKNNDQAAFQDYNRLWRQSRGMTPEPQPPINEQDVRDQMSYRAQQESASIMPRFLLTVSMTSRPTPLLIALPSRWNKESGTRTSGRDF